MNNSASTSNPSTQSDILNEVLTMIGHWWIELLLLAPFVALGLWGYRNYGVVVAGLLVFALVVIVIVPRRCRHGLAWILHQSRVRRQLTIAFASTGGVLQQRRPHVAKVERTSFGDRVTLHLARGTSSEDLSRGLAVIASSLGVATLRMYVDPRASNVVRLSLVRRDGFSESVPPCPLLAMNEWSLWEPVPVGFDDERRTVTLPLPEHNVLLGGGTGCGQVGRALGARGRRRTRRVRAPLAV
jgi:hypothetical protein